MKRLLAALLLLHGLALPAHAEGVSVRVANYPGFGRVVFDVPPDVEFQLVEEASRAILVFTGSPVVPAPAGLPRNFVVLQGGAGAATIVFKPGARVRASRVGQRVIIDAFDVVRGAAQARNRPASIVTPVAAPAAVVPDGPGIKTVAPPITKDAVPDRVAEPLSAAPIKISVEMPAAVLPPPLDTPAMPVRPEVTEAVLAHVAVTPERGNAILVPMAADTGAAAFRRGSQAVIVLDGRTTASIAGLDDAEPYRATVTEGPDTTVITMSLPEPATPHLTRTATGWLIKVKTGPGSLGAGSDNMVDPRTFKLAAPGRVVSVLDPVTGQPLLVGTIRVAGAGTGVRTGQRTPGHAVLPTWHGVVIEPLSDQVRLLPTADGFRLDAASTLQAAVAAPPRQLLTRKFDLPVMPVAAHLNRLHAQTAAAAAAPPRARGPARLAVAQSMLALGMATEAQAVLTLLAAEDPVMAARAEVGALTAIAALLSHRLDETQGLDGSSLNDTDEIGLWRAIRLAWRGQDAEAGKVLPRFLPLVMAYPDALRTRLLPTVLETAQRGDDGARAALAQHAADPTLDYARALQAERDGDTEAALATLDALTQSRDLLTQVRASARAAELRFTSGRFNATQTADVLDKQVLAWRGDGREIALRLRVAELRAVSGLWRAALEGLRDAARVASAGTVPASSQHIVGKFADVFRAMLAPGAPAIAPLDLVSLASEFAEQLPGGGDGDALRMLLAEKLGALDLPVRTQAVIRPLMQAAAPGPARAELGAVLAQSLLDSGDANAAGVAMAQSQADEMRPALRDQRSLILARIHAAEGRLPAAVATLTGLATPVADELRARLLEQAGDWRGAQAALADLGRKTIPATGLLDDRMQDVVLRQASTAVQAEDNAALQALRQAYLSRLQPPRLDLFRLLTAAPLFGSDDLPRARTDLALARAVPLSLQAMVTK